MAIASDVSLELCPAEQWFRYQAENLRLVAPIPDLGLVQDALKKHMPKRVERVLPRLSNPEAPTLWLSLILKANFLIQLWPTSTESVVVAMDVGGNALIAQRQLALIQSPEFSAARRELGIAKHWFLSLEDQMIVPSHDQLLDALYNQLSLEAECGIISW